MLSNSKIFIALFIVYGVAIYGLVSSTNFSIDTYSQKSLNIVNYWSQNSIVESNFMPIVQLDTNTSPKAIQYAISHPPFSYYFLFIFHKIFHTSYYFLCNIFLVMISGILIYLTIALLMNYHPQKELCTMALMGMLIYMTHPVVLQYQVLNYHPDIFVQVFLIAANYIMIKVMMRERYHSLKYILWFTMIIFLMNYTSWFGAIYTSIVVLIGLFNLRRGYKFFPYLIISVAVVIGTMMLIYSQYAYVGGWQNVAQYFKETFAGETFLAGHIRQTTVQILMQIVKNIGNLLFILLGMIGLSIWQRKRKFIFTKNGYRYVLIAMLPIVLYSIIFIQYFQNSYTSLYFIAPLAVTISIWAEKMYKNEPNKWKIAKLAAVIVLTNVLVFYTFQI